MIITRAGSPIADIVVDNKTTLNQTFLGDNEIKASFTLEEYIDFQLGDYTLWGGVTYTIEKQPQVKRVSANEYLYNLEFFGPEYALSNALFLLDGQSEFQLNGTSQTFLQLIVTNMNRVSSGYSAGSGPSTIFKTLVFKNENCFNVLKRVADEFELEYSITGSGKTLALADSVGNVTSLVFQFKSGLRNIERQEVEDGSLVTRLYAYGGERNIDFSTYGKKKLGLPLGATYIEQNVANFGLIENAVIYDDIYPRREAVVTGVEAGSEGEELIFYDSTMDFDINDQLSGLTAKVTFNSGLLAGYEFEIFQYTHVGNKFDLVSIIDDQNQVLPNPSRRPAIGDKYVIHDIIMPASYITAAEDELNTAASAFLNSQSTPNVVYTIQPDPVYFKTNLIELRAGDIIDINDVEFGLTLTTKVIGLTQSLADPYLYSIRVGDKVQIGRITRILTDSKNNADTIFKEEYDRRLQNARLQQGYKNLNEVVDLVFDQDGYYDSTKIRPESIETLSLTVGAKPLAMNFNGLSIEPNYLANKNDVNITASDLIHFTIEENVRTWSIPAASISIPDDNFRYLYVRVSIALSTGSWLVSENQLKITSSAGQYTFLVAIIHEVFNGTRGISQLYGQTFINGRFITTGRIQSVDQANYMDLDSNQFNLGNPNSGIDWNVSNAGTLTIRGSVIQRPNGSSYVNPVYRGTYSGAETYYEGDVVYYNGSSYIRIGSGPTTGTVPTNAVAWAIFANEGLQGPIGETGPTGVIGPEGADGADGINGIDGLDAIGSIPIDIAPAQFGGQGDFIFTLDAQAGGATNTGEVRIYATRFIKPDGTNITFSGGDIDNTLYTPYGEGALGRFYIIYSATRVSSRVPSLSFTDNSYFIPVRIRNATTWEAFDNAGNDVAISLVSSDVFLCVIEATGLSSGLTGYVGFVNGATGLDGEKGADGADGATGPQGPIGPTGAAGFDGADGIDGINGVNGNDGTDGVDGINAMNAIPASIAPAMIGGTGDLIITLDALAGGAVNLGEIRMQATRFTDPKGNNRTFGSYTDVSVITTFGEGQSGIFFIVYSATLVQTRFAGVAGLNNGYFFPVKWSGTTWLGVTNSSTTFAPNFVSTDSFICAIEAKQTTGGLTGFASFVNGATGLDGDKGPSIVFRGENGSPWVNAVYYNNSVRRDVIKYQGNYYIYNFTDNWNNTAWYSSRWQSFGAQFSSVATDLLLAESANIGDWIINNGRITAQNGKAIFYGTTGKFLLDGVANSSYDDTTRLSGDYGHFTGLGEGVFLAPNMTFDSNGNPNSAAYGHKAVVSGKCYGAGSSSVYRAGIHGLAVNDNNYSYGGMFTSLISFTRARIDGPIIRKTARRSGTFTLAPNSDYYITCTSTSYIYMNSVPEIGQTYKIKRATSGTVTLNGNGRSFWIATGSAGTRTINLNGSTATLTFDGSYWQLELSNTL